MFDPSAYMKNVCEKMILTKDKYLFTKVSGISALEGIVENARRNSYFFAVDDSQDGVTFRGAAAGFFERRMYTIFILGKADYGDQKKRDEVLEEAKKIYRHTLSKMIKDKLTIPVVKLDQIRFYEVPPAFAVGCSGLYFIVTVENPINLVYDDNAWVQ